MTSYFSLISDVGGLDCTYSLWGPRLKKMGRLGKPIKKEYTRIVDLEFQTSVYKLARSKAEDT